MRKRKTKKKLLRNLIIIMVLVLIVKLSLDLIYPLNYRKYINQYSKEYDLDPFLVAAVINVESKYDERAKSSKNARGLMQIGEQTGLWASEELEIEGYEEDLLYDPETNIKIGTWYLNKLNKEFQENLDLVLAAYNGGSGNVSKWLKEEKYSIDGKKLHHIPFPETQGYLKKVKANYQIYMIVHQNKRDKSENLSYTYNRLLKEIRK